MTQDVQAGFAVPTLPLEPIPHGTTLLLTGPRRLTASVAEQLALEGHVDSEGGIVVSTNTTGRNFVRQCEARYPDRTLDRVGFVDATGRADLDVETAIRLRSVSNTGDLTGISIALSILHSDLEEAGYGPIRNAFDTLSILMLYTSPKTMTRFVHTVGGRIDATDGLGAFVLDPSMHDKPVVHTLEHICDGRIRVAIRDGKPKLRIDGIPGQPTSWVPVEQ